MKNKFSLKQLSKFTRAFLILAFAFTVIGFATLGSVQTVGKSYRIPKQRSGDGVTPSINLFLSEPGHGEEGHVHRDLYVKKIYVNAGEAYTEYGTTATLRFGYGATAGSSFYTYLDYSVPNLYREVKAEESEEVTRETTNVLYNWGVVELNNSSGYRLATYPYWRISAVNGDVLLNEVVFVANDSDGTGEEVILNVSVETSKTNIPEAPEDVVKKAMSVVDRQKIPSLSESGFFKFAPEEVACLSTFTEMRQKRAYGVDNVNHMDRIYGALGLDILFLGPAIFGLSPFGFRFMPMLASVGVLLFTYLFVKRLTGSDKAAFFSSLLYALCGMSISLAHLGTPLMIGVFFLFASLYLVQGFFKWGMKRATLGSALPVMFAALFAAAAVCTNGAFIIPVLGICALFAAGVVRQRKRLYETISVEAEAAIEEEERIAQESEEGKAAPQSEGRKKVAKLVSDANYMRNVPVVLFFVILVVGFFLLEVFATLPLYSTYVKVLDNPASPSKNIFSFIFTAFAGGFIGNNGVNALPSAFDFVYAIFNGTGSVHALTAAGTFVSIAGVILGAVCAVISLIRLAKKKDGIEKYDYALLILLVGFVLLAATAFFAKGGLAFLLLAYLFLFVFASLPLSKEEGTKGEKALYILGIILAAVCFALFAAFTFSIPLPESIINILVR